MHKILVCLDAAAKHHHSLYGSFCKIRDTCSRVLRYLHWLLRIPRSRQRAVRVVLCSASRQALCPSLSIDFYTRFVVIIAYGIFWLNRLTLVICESGAFPSCVVNLLGRTPLIVYTVVGCRVSRPRRCPWTLRRTGKKTRRRFWAKLDGIVIIG